MTLDMFWLSSDLHKQHSILPSIQNPLGALPSRFRRERLLIVGCGDVGVRVGKLVGKRLRILAMSSTPERFPTMRAAGLTPLPGNLDDPRSLWRFAGIATRVVHLAPPTSEPGGLWWRDVRTTSLLRALQGRTAPRALVYGSTTGVYGNCEGQRVSESRPANPTTPRAQRRADAEKAVRHFGRASHARAVILRIPGIYAPDRPAGTPRGRLLKGTPVLEAKDDVYTNHIHADDLARAVIAALWRGRPQRVYNASDDTELKMGDYFDLAAKLYGLPPPPRIPRTTAKDEMPLMLLSFMSESRRLVNERLKTELRLKLRYPTVESGLAVAPSQDLKARTRDPAAT